MKKDETLLRLKKAYSPLGGTGSVNIRIPLPVVPSVPSMGKASASHLFMLVQPSSQPSWFSAFILWPLCSHQLLGAICLPKFFTAFK